MKTEGTRARWPSFLVNSCGLALTVASWTWARNSRLGEVWNLALIWCAPLLVYLVTFAGRRALNKNPDVVRAGWTTIFVHYAVMIALGAAIFSAIRRVQQQPGALPISQRLGQALVLVTGIVCLLTVVNLALSGLGAPFAAKLSSKLATHGMYAWTRNPMLLCTFGLLLSAGLRYRSLGFIMWIVVIVAPGWVIFIKYYEERELEIRFGESYTRYRERTPMFWPRPPRTGAPSTSAGSQPVGTAWGAGHGPL